jgi:hypothetical protein
VPLRSRASITLLRFSKVPGLEHPVYHSHRRSLNSDRREDVIGVGQQAGMLRVLPNELILTVMAG